MTPFLELAFILAAILLAAKLAGYISSRLGQPSVLGELVVGLMLGPSLLNLTKLSFIQDGQMLDTIITELGELGVLLLMFLAGLELHFSDLASSSRVSALSGILGVIFPVGLGWLAGNLYGMSAQQAMFLGLALGATSVSIAAQTMMELKVLRSRVGLGMLGAAVFDDVFTIFLLSSFIALSGSGNGVLQIMWVIARMLIFFLLAVLFGLKILPYLTRLIAPLPISQGMVTLAIVIMLVFGLASELVGGMASITGAFIAGLMFARTPEKNQLENGLHSLSYSFFVPIFFISVGLRINLRLLPGGAIWLILLVALVAITGKFLGACLGARLGKFSWREAVQLATGMISRGEVGLIVASIGMREGLLDNQSISAIIVAILICDLLTPILLKAVVRKLPVEKADQPGSSAS
ncbi:MAG: cation:proton antiporter [Anaerolineaceae bacterium]|jgi:Kef-type K+ transport system membrane component KefB